MSRSRRGSTLRGGSAFAGGLGVDAETRAGVPCGAPCWLHSHAPENAALFVDDTAFQAALKRLDPGDPAVFGAQLAGSAPGRPDRQVLAQRFLTSRPEAPRPPAGVRGQPGARPAAGSARRRLDALDDVYERWDGRGMPGGTRGDQLSLVARIVHVAEQAVLAAADGGVVAARREIGAGRAVTSTRTWPPRFVRRADALLAALDAPDLLAAVLAAEPAPAAAGDDGLSGAAPRWPPSST